MFLQPEGLELAGPQQDRAHSWIARSLLQNQTLVLLRLCCCGGFQSGHNCLISQMLACTVAEAAEIAQMTFPHRHAKGSTYLIKHILELVLRQGTTLDVFHRAQLFGHPLAILLPHWLHLLLGQLVLDTRIVSQINLCTNNQAGNTRAVMMNLWEPLLANVFKRSWRSDTKADKEDIGLRIREGS